MTRASPVFSSPTMVQLHWRIPTGKVSRIMQNPYGTGGMKDANRSLRPLHAVIN
jgi:hypothetical protein